MASPRGAGTERVTETSEQPNRVIPAGQVPRVAGAAARRIERLIRRTANRGRLRALVNDLPPSMRSAAEWIVAGQSSGQERDLAARIERLRDQLATSEEKMLSFHSPLPGTFRTGDGGLAEPGPRKRQTARAHSRTGSRPRKGILLRRIAEASGAGRILELGTNTGLSACWMVSSAQVEMLVTVEGSPELAEVARGHIGQFSQSFHVRNQLFDDALDDLAASGAAPFQLCFIDGQHEGEATLHYHQRVLPLMDPVGGIVLYDDIYWSHDMRRAWQTIVDAGDFAMTVDLGLVGAGILGRSGPQRHVDIAGLVGRPHVPTRIGDASGR